MFIKRREIEGRHENYAGKRMAAKAGRKYNLLCPMASYHHILYTVEKTGPNLQPLGLGGLLTHPSSDVGACLPCLSIPLSVSILFLCPSSLFCVYLSSETFLFYFSPFPLYHKSPFLSIIFSLQSTYTLFHHKNM